MIAASLFLLLLLVVAAMFAGLRWVRWVRAEFSARPFEDYELRERIAYDAGRR